MKKNRATKFLSILLTMCMLLGMLPMTALAENLSDIKGHWAESEIKEMVKEGIVKGYPDGFFKPDREITRAEFVNLIVKAFKLTKAKGKDFDDISNHWAKDAILTASAHGIVNGYSATKFGPDNPITREQMAVMIVKAAHLNEDGKGKTFVDNQDISEWAKEAVAIASSNQLITGYSDNTFKPSRNTSRAEAIKVLSKILMLDNLASKVDYSLIEKSGKYGPIIGNKIVKGDVVIKSKDTILQNLVIKGDLTISKEVGDGDVTLNNIKVEGKTYIRGGGIDSIYINGGEYREIIIERTITGAVRIVVTNIQGLTITISENDNGEDVILNGDIKIVTIKASGIKLISQGKTTIDKIEVIPGLKDVKIQLTEDTEVKEIILNSKVDVKGKGKIDKASGSKVNESTFATTPKLIIIPSTGESDDNSSDDIPITPTIKVSAISVKGTGDVDKITTDSGTLQMIATVEPDNASNRNVTWSVDKPQIATIDKNSGVLIAVANGTVIVTATAKDGSGVNGTASIEISNQILVDKSELLEIISGARILSEFVKVSTDGSDVGKCEFWVSSSAIKNTYERAIEDAQAVANKANPSQTEIKQAIADLETAMDVFYQALKPGTGEVAIVKITEIAITGVIPPNHGEKVNFGYTIPSDANYIKIDRGEWYDLSKPNNPRLMEETDTFLSGEEYKFRATLVAKPCYEFDFQNPSVTINGEQTSDFKKANEDGFMEVAYKFTATGPEIHYVNFHSDDWSDQVIVEDGETISLPVPPAKEGYIFGGWYTGKDGKGKEFTASTPVTAEFSTLHAKWTLITYTVTFDSGGGSLVDPITGVVPKATVILPAPPTKTNFEFSGWYTGKDGAGTKFTESTPVTGDITVYAKWTGENILVTSIIVSGEDGATTITTGGGTLQMIAKVEPATASNRDVNWSVDSKIATINSGSGLLKAVGNGTVTVTATALDGSGISGSFNITITGQPTCTLTIEVEGNGTVTPDTGGEHERGSAVEIEAIPNAGWYFEKWEGEVKKSNKAKTTVTMSKDKTIKAVFVQGGNTAGFAGGSGTEDNPYQVATANHLNNVRNYLDAHFIQTADIDLSSIDNWMPIGVNHNSFTGSYDGKNYKIKNMKINRKDDFTGLFGDNKGNLSNIKMINVDIKCKGYSGGLAGLNNDGGKIKNSSVTGNISGTYLNVGGLIGWNKATITDSHTTCQVEGSRSVGGLVGLNEGTISNSYAIEGAVNHNIYHTDNIVGYDIGGLVGKNNGEISESHAGNSVKGIYNVGGLVGFNDKGTINLSYATGATEGTRYVGGLVGENKKTISDSYATGAVTVKEYYVGGLVGKNTGEISKSYATGQVAGTGNNVGGLVGVNDSDGKVSESYWDKETTERDKSSGSDDNFGKTTIEMQTQATYVNWDFTDTWSINANSYPHLKWQVANP